MAPALPPAATKPNSRRACYSCIHFCVVWLGCRHYRLQEYFSRTYPHEPHLGNARITVLYEYTAVEAALARTCPHDARVAERFELYACGVELANGFGELTDPQEQRRRFEAEMDMKQKIYGERYPIDEELLEALSLMPPASGVALGLDRLIMLAAGAMRIDQVQWTPMP